MKTFETEFVPPFQGLNSFGIAQTQGVALGCPVVRFQRRGMAHARCI